jgi:hypothetical protein
LVKIDQQRRSPLASLLLSRFCIIGTNTTGLTPKILLAIMLYPSFIAPLESGAAKRLDLSWETCVDLF